MINSEEFQQEMNADESNEANENNGGNESNEGNEDSNESQEGFSENEGSFISIDYTSDPDNDFMAIFMNLML